MPVGDIRALFIVPLHEEMAYLDNFLTSHMNVTRRDPEEHSPHTDRFFYEIDLHERRVRLDLVCSVLGDAGNLHASVRTAELLRSARIGGEDRNITILIGIGGGLDEKKISIGDVVISGTSKTIFPDKIKKIDTEREFFHNNFQNAGSISPEIEHLLESDMNDSANKNKIPIDVRKKMFGDSFFRFRRGIVQSNHVSQSLIERYHGIVRDRGAPLGLIAARSDAEPRVLGGHIFSTDMVVDSFEFINFINFREKNNTYDYYSMKSNPRDLERNKWIRSEMLVADMESFGFFSIIPKESPAAIAVSVRGISDMAKMKEESDANDKMNFREIAAKNAIVVAIDFLRTITGQ